MSVTTFDSGGIDVLSSSKIKRGVRNIRHGCPYTIGADLYRRAQPFNLPAQPFNLSISDKLWTLEKNKGHFIIPEFNSSIIKWPLFFSKVHGLSDIDRLKSCAGRLKGCALR